MYLTYCLKISSRNSLGEYIVNKFDVSTILTSQSMDCQIHVIEKAIRPLFADPGEWIQLAQNFDDKIIHYYCFNWYSVHCAIEVTLTESTYWKRLKEKCGLKSINSVLFETKFRKLPKYMDTYDIYNIIFVNQITCCTVQMYFW